MKYQITPENIIHPPKVICTECQLFKKGYTEEMHRCYYKLGYTGTREASYIHLMQLFEKFPNKNGKCPHYIDKDEPKFKPRQSTKRAVFKYCIFWLLVPALIGILCGKLFGLIFLK